MILLAGIVFTIVIGWLAVVLVGGLLGLLARPIVRRLRARWRRRRVRRVEREASAGGARRRALLPDPASDWWPEFERQLRAHVRAREHSLRHRPGRERDR